MVVLTANTRGAGTDADVYIQIEGDGLHNLAPAVTSATSTGWLQLLSRGADDFERGATDEFVIEGADVNKITAVKLGVDPRGVG